MVDPTHGSVGTIEIIPIVTGGDTPNDRRKWLTAKAVPKILLVVAKA